MGDLLIGAHQTLHEISQGNPNFTGNVHLQSQQGDFLFSHPTPEELDNGSINFEKSKGGYAMIPVSKYRTGMIALKSQTPINVRMWADQISKVATDNKPTDVSSTKVSNKTDRNISLVLWIGVIAILLYIINSRKKCN